MRFYGGLNWQKITFGISPLVEKRSMTTIEKL